MIRMTPKNLIVQVLSAGRGQVVSVEDFILVGNIFGFKSNAVRVALARLVKDFMVESDERGFYRLHPSHNPKDEWIYQWRLGVKRMRRWDGGWLGASFLTRVSPKERQDSLKIIRRFGFAEGIHEMWIRPDNLRTSLSSLRQALYGMGLTQNMELFVCNGFSTRLVEHWKDLLWPLKQIKKQYHHLLQSIEKSQKKCPDMPLEQALLETFMLGGEIIYSLARDPLLPEEIASQDLLKKLTQAMLDYDRLGRHLWKKQLPQLVLDTTPVQLKLIKSA